MSRYLVERILAAPAISVRTGSQVARVEGGGRVERVADVDELVVHIGGDPLTAGVRDLLRLDPRGLVMTGPDLRADAGGGRWWPLERDPFPLRPSGRPGGCGPRPASLHLQFTPHTGPS
jgi:thioredoxin reductase (NADPH)